MAQPSAMAQRAPNFDDPNWKERLHIPERDTRVKTLVRAC